MKHTDHNHLGQVMKCLDHQRKDSDGSFCDYTIEVQGQQFRAHRCVLVSSSEYFKTLFSTCLYDKQQQVHKLHVGSAEAMSNILDYIYSGKISLTINKLFDLLTLADYLLIPEIKDIATFFLMESIGTVQVFDRYKVWRETNDLNWTRILKIAEHFHLTDVCEKMILYLEEVLHLILEDENILNASFNTIKTILCNHNLNYIKEESLFELIIRWTQHKPKRACLFPDLFNLLLIEYMPLRYIDIRVSKEPLCSENKGIKLKISQHLQSRKSLENKDVVVMFAGGKKQKDLQYSDLPLINNDDSASNVIHILGYITDDDQWFNIGNLDLTNAQDASKTCSVETHGKIYVFVAGLFPIFASLDLADKNNIWNRLTPPSMFPYAHALAATDSFIFALGDSGSMMKYCIATNQWETCTNCLITYPHVQNMVYYLVSHNNRLYAIVSASTFFYELSHFKGQFTLGEYDIEHDRWNKLQICNIPEGQMKKMTRLIFSVESERNQLMIMQEHGRRLAVYEIDESRWILPAENHITSPSHLKCHEVDRMVFLKNSNSQLYLFSARGAYPGMDKSGTPTMALFDCSCGRLKMRATPPFRYKPQEVSLSATRVASEVLNGFMPI